MILTTVDVSKALSLPRDQWREALEPLARELTEKFYPGCIMGGVGLFTLAPGQMHPAHTDIQPPEWVTRVHIPLVTNPHCTMTMRDGFHEMKVGTAYLFDTRQEHAVSNAGKTERVHLVFDIRKH